jgi:hypothetical protein
LPCRGPGNRVFPAAERSRVGRSLILMGYEHEEEKRIERGTAAEFGNERTA